MYAFSMKTVQRFDGCVWMRPQVVFQGLLVCSVIVINDGKKKKNEIVCRVLKVRIRLFLKAVVT